MTEITDGGDIITSFLKRTLFKDIKNSCSFATDGVIISGLIIENEVLIGERRVITPQDRRIIVVVGRQMI
jgi:hypothetical protein